jgi:putative PEP-CTERM system TPR-repeat lipoprotein
MSATPRSLELPELRPKSSKVPAWTVNAVLLVTLVLGLASAGCSKDGRRDSYLKRAQELFEKREFEKATLEYMNVLRLDPGNSQAMRYLGLSHFERGQLGRSLPFLLKTKETDPDDLEVRVRLGRLYQSRHAGESARQEALFVLERNPTNAPALLLLIETQATPEEREQDRPLLDKFRQQGGDPATVLIAEGTTRLYAQDLAGAEAKFQEAAKLDPRSGRAWLALGFVLMEQGKLEQADQAYHTAADLSAPASTDRLKWAEFKIRTGAADEGRKMLEQMTRDASDFTAAWGVLALLTFDQKDYKESARLAKEVVRQDPENFTGLLLMAKISAAEGDGARALGDFKRLALTHPRSPAAHYELAVALARSGDLANAVIALKHVLSSLDPTHTDAQRMLGQLSLKRGDVPTGTTLLEALVKRNERDWLSQLSLAEAYNMAARPQEALAVYEKLMALYPKQVQIPFLKGIIHRQLNQLEAARVAFRNALKLSPDFLPAASQLLDLYLAAKEYPPAQELADDLVRRVPGSAESHFLLARVHLAQQKNSEAEAALLKALELDPQLTSACSLLAQFYVATKRHTEALARLESILKTNPNDLGALSQAAMLHERLKDYDKAAQKYEQVLNFAPNAGLILNNLAYLYAERLNQLSKGYPLAQKAREAMHDNPLVADTLGWIQFRRADYAQALPLLQEAADKLPTQQIVFYHLGMTHYMMGNEAAAQQALERSLKDAEKLEHAEDAKQRLEVLRLDATNIDAAGLRNLESRTGDPVAALRLARIQERKGNVPQAAALYERALAANPNLLPAMLSLAGIYSQNADKRDRAIELVKAARPLSKDDPQTLAALGRAVYQAGDPAWGLPLLEIATSRAPKDPALQYDLAMCTYLVGRLAKAVELLKPLAAAPPVSAQTAAAGDLLFWAAETDKPQIDPGLAGHIEKTLKVTPDYLPARYADALLRVQRGKPEDARAALESIAKVQPQFTPARRHLGLLLAKQGNDQDAFPLLTQSQRENPGDVELASALGRLEYRKKDFTAAVRTLGTVVPRQPADAEAHFYLGMANHQIKRPKEARENLTKALELGLTPTLAAEASRVLDEAKPNPAP